MKIDQEQKLNKIVGIQINEETNLLLILEMNVSNKKIEQQIETKTKRGPKSISIEMFWGENTQISPSLVSRR